MSRLAKKFKELKEKKKSAFIAYITAGHPNSNITRGLIFELERCGVDIIELGVPFSDPLADGPVIQAASQHALKNGATLESIIKLVKDIRKKVAFPLCLMSYYNPIYRMGIARFAQKAKEAGVDAVIVPDLPPEEAKGFIRLMRRNKVDSVFFASPTSDVKRVKLAARASSGFIYYVSLTGVTGARGKLARDIKEKIKLIKKYTDKPVCVGFGVSRPEQVKEISLFCDGVIVGSAIVKKIADNFGAKDLVEKVGGFVRTLTKPLNEANV